MARSSPGNSLLLKEKQVSHVGASSSHPGHGAFMQLGAKIIVEPHLAVLMGSLLALCLGTV